MSSIDRLQIAGIRSFNPRNPQAIKFFTPLTLIVGYNGSGKTTIIECLKYATTSELPPNSTKGGAFIHDPDLLGETSVEACVSLKYKTPPDTTYVLSRRIQLTVKRGTRTQKTLEGALHQLLDGEKTTMSKQKAKLDELVLKHLNVPKAILEFVIFCHQDESLWPMSEPSILKKRFDEIFEAMKYTKAIDNLKMLRKKQGEKLRSLKEQELRDKADKEKADECARRSQVLENEIAGMKVEIQELKRQKEEAERRAKKLHEEANSYLGIVQELKVKKEQLTYRQDTAEETKSRMDEMAESDTWLEDTLAQYEERVSRLKKDYQENVAQYSEYQKELTRLHDDRSKRLTEQGKLQSDKEKYERQLEARVELVHQEARTHNIRGFDGDLDEHQIQTFNDRIHKSLADKKKELERLQTENAEDLEKKANDITELEGRKARYTQDRSLALQQNSTLEKRIGSARQLLNAVDIDEGARAILDSSFKDIEQRFEKAVQDQQDANLDAKIQEENDQLQQYEIESGRLSRELGEASRLAASRGELDFHQKKIATKSKELEALRSSSGSSKISSMVSVSWEPATLERQFQQALEGRAKAHEEAKSKRDGVLQDQKLVQGKISSIKEKIKKRDSEMERFKSTVIQALEANDPELKQPNVADLPGAISKLENEVLEAKEDLALNRELKTYYEKCQRTLDKENKCELCHHHFANASEKSAILKKIRHVLEKFNEAEARADIAEMEQFLKMLRAARPAGDNYERLLKEKPAQDKEREEAEAEESNILKRLEDMDEDVHQKHEERQDLESISKMVREIANTYREMEESTARVDRLMSQQQSGGAVRSVDEINDLQEACKEKIRAVTHRISKLTSERQHLRDQISNLELERSEFRNKINDADRLLERKKELQAQIEAHKEDIATQKGIIQQANKDLESIDPQISHARAIRDDALQRGRAKEKKAADERDSLASSVNSLKAIESDIQAYIDGGGPSRLTSNENAVQTLKKDISNIETDMNDLTARTNKLKEEITNSSSNRKNIVDNINYRKVLREIEKLEHDIGELESRNASEDYDQLTEEVRAVEHERDNLVAARGSILGTVKAKDDELGKLIEDWNTHYHDAGQKYRETHIKVETTKAAVEDLGKYTEALNDAIMKYHGLKMEEVNRITAELWRETYQGTDIDTILIKSDSESATGRQAYNYRVCMIKQGAEMDMRGRCSAGQKVLASIIIRLALAEAFGVGCGLIALDEPTTNLDRDNIRSLAQSLHGIIAARKQQRNFQLIVITHDEEFLRHMQCSDFADYLHRVKRDDKQNSIIKQEPISTIM